MITVMMKTDWRTIDKRMKKSQIGSGLRSWFSSSFGSVLVPFLHALRNWSCSFWNKRNPDLDRIDPDQFDRNEEMELKKVQKNETAEAILDNQHIEQFYESTTSKMILMKICKDNIQVTFVSEYLHQLSRMNVILFLHYKGINYFTFIYFKRDFNIFEEFLNLSLNDNLIRNLYNQINDYLDESWTTFFSLNFEEIS